MKSDTELRSLIDEIVQFRDDRDWAQFHDGKNLAINLSVEAGELLELFLWKAADEVDREKLKDELADVLYSALLLAETYGLDVAEVVRAKLKKNEAKYPVEKFKGSREKG